MAAAPGVAWAAKQERRRRRARTERQVAVRGTGRPRRGRRAPRGARDATSLRPRDCQRAVGGISAASAQDEVRMR